MRRPPYYKRLLSKLRAKATGRRDILLIYAGRDAWKQAKAKADSHALFLVCPDDVHPGRLNWSISDLARFDIDRTEAIILRCGKQEETQTRQLITALMTAWADLVTVIDADGIDETLIYRKGRAA